VKSPLHRAVTRRPQGGLAHGPLPSVKQFQQQHDVDRDTVLRAVEILRDEGLVFTVPGEAPMSAQTPSSGPQSHVLRLGKPATRHGRLQRLSRRR
jgi:DNA-binding transcriptional MocR family regulator